MKTMTKLIISAFAAATLLPAVAMAGTMDTTSQGYLVDGNGGTVVMSGTGLCWQVGQWSDPRSSASCNGVIMPVALAAPVAEPIMPIAALPVVKPLQQKFTFAGDAMFAFDQAVLKPEGKTMLDGLVRQIDGVEYDTIVATGHTDRFGSNDYNLTLSERRAQAVKDYLVSQNVQSGRIDAGGRGEMQPVTNLQDCKGAKSTQVVACLQPDRRVEIEMIGTRAVIGSL